MQSVSSRIWTRVAVFISYSDNNYTTGTSIYTTGTSINKITVIQIVIGTLSTVTKGLVHRLEGFEMGGQVKTI